MIGLVVVSHSRALAEAAVALAVEMVPGQQPTIAVAAGLDDGGFGTDAAAVAEAIARADSPDGVLVLMDLGSAVMAAELATEFLDPDIAARVTLSPAPLIEGLVAAVVTAAAGAPLDQVNAEALRGLTAKQQHLSDTAPPADTPTDADADADLSRDVEVVNTNGFHARPAARLVTLVGDFDAEVSITNSTRGIGPVAADSMIMLVSLDSRRGDRLRVTAAGPDAQQAISATVDFIATGMGE